MPRVVVLDDAEDELVAAEDWYEDQREGLGIEFREEVAAAVRDIAATPNISRRILDVPGVADVRKIAVKRFPYSVVPAAGRHSVDSRLRAPSQAPWLLEGSRPATVTRVRSAQPRR